ncbi:MAG: Asp-tRNA(Asn)/Glu-tRNA(Gln) amidotransferase subunit GatA [Anaerolineae bacterium]|jgi:aspartyl-tRNA(Asn)/glutamyl-tRNA(Gln) amidotransferase subunit A|nr:Asp-tRNA(Asn)/Glu-tRNA(Gln) amidotransferase subunit GatA [Anaerolineae bacterium]MBT7069299.1 Asp-tRNA(Asn)/Glu-tRNA(Gln) amidotransferase subunit GatA [Anaerolineae bacterium]MBT7325985.1 Asp-tRNA(Asn)/Glu-tRNA(Gln) amidotransferase subunit GatA [Anaerolineae bacterium]
MNLHTLNISEAQTLIQQKKISPVELVEACLRQIDIEETRINAFITVTAETARAQAKEAESLQMKLSAEEMPLLLGIPFAAKDLYDTAGIRTTGGTSFRADDIPKEDAEVIRRLKNVGMILLGKTNTHEIALGVTTVNPHYGATHNPHDTNRIAGGSSGGSAAALAANMCPAALGTDTGGSIRIPASLCGVVGLKPTFGRVSLRGIMPLSWNLDHAGPMTRSVNDAGLMLNAMAGYDARDPSSVDVGVEDYASITEANLKGVRIGLAEEGYLDFANPEVASAVREAASVFQSLGAKVESIDFSWLTEAARANGLMTPADGAAYHHERMNKTPEVYGKDVLRRLRTGAAYTSSEYSLARRTQAETKRRMEIFFGEYGLLLLPSTAVTAPPIEGKDAVEEAKLLTRFTAPFNLTGLPVLSLPCGVDGKGLPIGLQIVGAAWQEKKILEAGYAYELETKKVRLA